jgi:hypothetical protein
MRASEATHSKHTEDHTAERNGDQRAGGGCSKQREQERIDEHG